MGFYDKIYTIGNVRRQNQFQLADNDGNYVTEIGEQLGYRYEVTRVIDSGAFGQVLQCIDHKDSKKRSVAAKISKNKKADVDNANVEIKLLKKLSKLEIGDDSEGYDRIVKITHSFNFRQHVIIIFEQLHFNLYNFQRLNKFKKNVFSTSHLKSICH